MGRKGVLWVVIQYIFLIMAIIVLNFILVRIMPGSPLDYLTSNPSAIAPMLTEEVKKKLIEYYGLNKPLLTQFRDYILNILHGRLGYSIYYGEPVSTILKPYLERSLILVSIGLTITIVVSIPLALAVAFRRGSKLDSIVTSIMVSLYSTPPYFIAMLMLLLLAVKLKLIPIAGYSINPTISSVVKNAVPPAVVFALCEVGGMYYFCRNAILEVLGQEYMILALAKGLRDRVLMFRHALRAAAPAIASRISLLVGFSFASSMFVEYVFSYPGVMSLLTTAFENYDYPLIHAILIIFSIIIVTANFIADLVMILADPRTRSWV